MAAVSWDCPTGFGAMRVVNPHYRVPCAGPISPVSPVNLSPVSPSSANGGFGSESASIASTSSLSSFTSAGSTSTQLATPSSETSRRTIAVSRLANSRQKVPDAVYSDAFDVSFASLLDTVPSELLDDETLNSPVLPHTAPLQLRRPSRSDSLPYCVAEVDEEPRRVERRPTLTIKTPTDSTAPRLQKSRSEQPLQFDRQQLDDLGSPPPYEEVESPQNRPAPTLQVHPPDNAPAFAPIITSPTSSSASHSTLQGLGIIDPPEPPARVPSPRRKAVPPVDPQPQPERARTAATNAKGSVSLPTSRQATPPTPANDKRSVRVEMVDIYSFLLHWDAPELVPAPKWLVSARAYVLDNQRLVIDIHRDTPSQERKWLLKLALECYMPMRQRYLDVREILRLSLPEMDLSALRTTAPTAVPEMKRNEFKRAGSGPATRSSLNLPRVVLQNPWRNVYRVLYNVSGDDPLWVPNGVVIDLTSEGDAALKIDEDTPDEFRSATMNTMLMHALRRIAGSDEKPPQDVQRAMKRTELRRMSFHPKKIAVSFVGRYGGMIDITLPEPRGSALAPAWHQPVRVYLTTGAEFWYEFDGTTPAWRVEEIQRVVESHIGVQIEAWSDIRRIIGGFAPTDPRLAKMFAAPGPVRRGCIRRSFVPKVTRTPINGVTPTDPRAEKDLPRLLRRREGVYALEYPAEADVEPAVLNCASGKPQVYIHEKAKHVTMMVAWLFSIVAAIFEN